MGARPLSLSYRNRELLYLAVVGVLTGIGFASVYIARQAVASWGSLGYAAFWLAFASYPVFGVAKIVLLAALLIHVGWIAWRRGAGRKGRTGCRRDGLRVRRLHSVRRERRHGPV